MPVDFIRLIVGEAPTLLVAWLLNYLVQSTLLVGLVWLLAGRGLVRSNLLADRLWKLALVGGIVTSALPLAAGMSPAGGRVHLEPATALSQPARSAADLSGGEKFSAAGADESTPSAGSSPSAAAWTGIARWPDLFLALWLMGAGVAGARLAAARMRLTRQLASRRAVADRPLRALLAALCREAGITRRVRLTCSAEIKSPLALGRWEVCLPERALTSLTAQEQQALLAHELAHLLRRDPAWLMMAALVESLFFFQPLNRLARRRLQEVAEYLCDDWAVQHTGGNLSLARCLLEVAGWMVGSHRPGFVPAMAGGESPLVRRVGRLLASTRQAPERPRRRWLLLLAGLPLLVGCGMPSISLSTLPSGAGQAVTAPAGQAAPDSYWSAYSDPNREEAGEKRIELSTGGEITYTASKTDVVSVSKGGSFILEETGGATRKLVVEPDGNGALRRSYFVDGAEQPYDAAASSWLANLLPGLLAGVDDVPRDWPRLPRLPLPEAGSGSTSTFSLQRQGDGGTTRIEGAIEGRVDFNAATTDVSAIGERGSFQIEESGGGTARSLLVEPGAGGELRRTYQVDGQEQPYDEAARAWLAGILPEVLSHLNFEGNPRPLFPDPFLPDGNRLDA